ncbi:hypothetical protein [Paraliomyxa miuraensis]|uniref:hypothetical protein n=1 Tax=Paraliomyxa miuraensis TaxID=376150 RepID=UPI00225031BB|nr:hypothetical protein [Paraliomyxa miuraensis]MCX4241468.1 hypothetical protein [Paraliomyxa miuraensis]
MATSGGKDDATIWKRCSTCRGPIDLGDTYYVCSVSTCNRARTIYRFCTVECWEEHLPLMRHREAWAVEETAPTRAEWEEPSGTGPDGPTSEISKVDLTATTTAPAVVPASPDAPRRRIRVGSAPRPAAPPEPPGDVLVVVSRFKSYVKERFGMNTSDGVFDVLSDHLRVVARRAAENARADGRKTVMDRDLEFLRKR